MKRKIDNELAAWSEEPQRKPLLLRGARQVGKTYSVRMLGRRFRHFVEINFEEKPDAGIFFKNALSAQPLCEKLSVFAGTPIVSGETLLFLDEVQACPEVLASLRYFHEQMPGLHVVAAGSLLEFALQKIPSLGVGRITSRFMYPLVFPEFLEAVGEGNLLPVLEAASCSAPIDAPFHRKLSDLLRTYMLVGGMPEAVAKYAATRDLLKTMNVLDDLIVTFFDDFEKYHRRTPVERLDKTLRSVVSQAGGKFVCAAVDKETKSTAILDALDLLVKAGLVHQVFQTAGAALPLGAQADARRFKALLFDVGIHQRLSGLDLSAYMTSNDALLVNKGSMAELLVGLHLAAYQSCHRRPELYYWHREVSGANAEIDYLVQQGNHMCPIEVKAGTRGGMQSLRLFLKLRGLRSGLRVSMENFGKIEDAGIVPLYAAYRLLEGNGTLMGEEGTDNIGR